MRYVSEFNVGPEILIFDPLPNSPAVVACMEIPVINIQLVDLPFWHVLLLKRKGSLHLTCSSIIFSDPYSWGSEAGWLSDSNRCICYSVSSVHVDNTSIGYLYHYYFSPRLGFYERDTVTYRLSITTLPFSLRNLFRSTYTTWLILPLAGVH